MKRQPFVAISILLAIAVALEAAENDGLPTSQTADVASGPTAVARSSEFRQWQDNTGRYAVEARLQGVEEEHVVLQRADGRVVRTALARLSESDCGFVATWQLEAAGFRQWSDRTGVYSATARLLAVEGESVVLERVGGRVVRPAVSRLSASDCNYVTVWQSRLAAANDSRESSEQADVPVTFASLVLAEPETAEAVPLTKDKLQTELKTWIDNLTLWPANLGQIEKDLTVVSYDPAAQEMGLVINYRAKGAESWRALTEDETSALKKIVGDAGEQERWFTPPVAPDSHPTDSQRGEARRKIESLLVLVPRDRGPGTGNGQPPTVEGGDVVPVTCCRRPCGLFARIGQRLACSCRPRIFVRRCCCR